MSDDVQVEPVESRDQGRRTLEEENVCLIAEVKRLEKVEQGLDKENARLRGDRRSLKDENAHLRRMLAVGEGKVERLEEKAVVDGSEIKRLQERYREVTDEKVALAEQLAVSHDRVHIVIILNLYDRVLQSYRWSCCSISQDMSVEITITELCFHSV
jgi:chromosome segregation ATPase